MLFGLVGSTFKNLLHRLSGLSQKMADIDIVLAARQRVESLTVDGIKDRRHHLLLAMLDYLQPPGRQTIAQEISDCVDGQELKDLATHYITSVFMPSTFSVLLLGRSHDFEIILLVKATGAKTPRPTSSSSSADEQVEVQVFDNYISSSQPRMVERICLQRDGYRCADTGAWSTKTPEHLLPANANGYLDDTETCHIIPLSLAQYGDSHEAVCFPPILAMLRA